MLKGEYEKQIATVALFPYRKDVWRDNAVPAQKMMTKLVNTIARYQRVVLGVLPGLVNEVKEQYEFDPSVEIFEVLYDDCWARDMLASVFIDSKGKRLNVLGFNAYGGELYASWANDAALNENLTSKIFNYEVKHYPVTMEWGNIAPDGNGTIFVVEDSVVNSNRNPFMSKGEIEKTLIEATGCKQIIWLPCGLSCDETGGHVDNILAFADKHTMLMSYTDDRNNPHYKNTHILYDVLSQAKDVDGNRYRIVKLPVPAFHQRTEVDSRSIIAADGSLERKSGDSVLYTYVNYAQVNGAIIIPAFGLEEDDIAVNIIKKVYPDRDVVKLDATEAYLGGGGFHCLTKHIN